MSFIQLLTTSCHMSNYRLVIKKIDMILKKFQKTTSIFRKIDVVNEKQL